MTNKAQEHRRIQSTPKPPEDRPIKYGVQLIAVGYLVSSATRPRRGQRQSSPHVQHAAGGGRCFQTSRAAFNWLAAKTQPPHDGVLIMSSRCRHEYEERRATFDPPVGAWLALTGRSLLTFGFRRVLLLVLGLRPPQPPPSRLAAKIICIFFVVVQLICPPLVWCYHLDSAPESQFADHAPGF